MASGTQGSGLLVELSDSLAAVVEHMQPSIVRVNARKRLGATGWVWRADGLIVTADHVVERDEEITVGLPGGDEVPATVVGRDQGTDLAVLRVDRSGLIAAEPSGPVRVGHLVLALGRPHGEAAMASLGVISAAGGHWRSWRGGSIEGVVRTDVTLYPGFSGGPLVDASGRVVGMNTSILARGLAITVPYAVVDRVAGTLTSGGGAKRGYLGIATQPVTLPESLRQSLGLEQTSGLLVVGVEPNSPAERAGLLLGDTLVSFGGRTISDIAGLQDALGLGSAGAEQTVQMVRAGQLATLGVQIGER